MRIQEILQETTIDEGVNDQNIFKVVWMIGPKNPGPPSTMSLAQTTATPAPTAQI